MNVPYPLAGTTNSAVRAASCRSSGGPVTWMQLPGDPREHYIARMQWVDARHAARPAAEPAAEHRPLPAGRRRAPVGARHVADHDDAFITIGFGGLPEARPLRGGAEFLVASREGRLEARLSRHARRDARRWSRAARWTRSRWPASTRRRGWLYFIASPDERDPALPVSRAARRQRRSRARHAGVVRRHRTATPSRPTADSRSIASPASTIPASASWSRLPDHKVIAVVDDNADAEGEARRRCSKPPVEFFKADAGDGVMVDGYMLKPPRLRSVEALPGARLHLRRARVPDGRRTAGAAPRRSFTATSPASATSSSASTTAARRRRAAAPGGRGLRRRRRVVVEGAGGGAAMRSAPTAPYVDLDRVAVWGWSGGGTNTLNLMFRSPDLYKVGMAVAPVPDQRLYDTIYQERYMGLPRDERRRLQAGSAINFAEGLKGDLLIVHGSGDDNVHYQGTELLVNRLIELGKPFDFMIYPDRTHAIAEGPGTTPHLYHLLTRYLTAHLPPDRARRPPGSAFGRSST